MTDVMRIATGQFREPTDDLLQFAAQMGVSGVVLNTPNLPGDTHWEFMDLIASAHALRSVRPAARIH